MSEKEKSTTSSITTAFSFDEVISIFTGIDNKIISLHQCSSEDFNGLNKKFRQFHAESKTISDNAQTVLEVITRNKTLQALRNLKILNEQLNKQIRHVDLFLVNSGNLLYNTISGIERTLLSLRILRQNLTTIKFLITNLKLESSYNSTEVKEGELTISRVYSCIGEIIAQAHIKENVLLEIKMILMDNQDKLADLSDENYGALEKSFKSITNKINRLVEIRQNALSAIPRLKQINENCRENISQIITNLQYHDIIKQKIDHIQVIHRNLVKELDELKKGDETGRRHSYAKFFLKIRDVAGLQAAQLIHANKAYQNAIKEITSSLTNTGESMSEISQLCKQFVSTPELFDILNEKDLQLQLEELSLQVNQDKALIAELSDSIANALQKIKILINDQPAMQQSAALLVSDLKNTICHFETSNKNENNQVISQIELLVTEFLDMAGKIGRDIENESNNLFLVHKTQSSFIEGRSVYLNRLFITTDDLLCARGKSIARQLDTLQGNIREGSSITREIRKSIDRVKYYDFFENVIEEIIAELNNINFKLRFIGSGIEVSGKDENLSHLRSQYTMESEHKIHDTYSKKNTYGNVITSLNDCEIETGEKDDLELF